MLQKQHTAPLFTAKDTKAFRIAIVKTDYHETFVNSMGDHARETLIANGVLAKNIVSFTAPGAWEIPQLAKHVIDTKQFDAILTFGVIIKGDTLHFEMIANETGRALMTLAMTSGVPIALEILAVFTVDQAKKRTKNDSSNKGIEAAHAVLKTLLAMKHIKTTRV